MEYRTLGRTGVSIGKLSLGTMMFGAWGNTDHDACIDIVERAVDAGINLVDTADSYSAGESEVVVGKAIRRVGRDQIFLATKVFAPMGAGQLRGGGSRRWIMSAVDDSLRRLGVDHIDLYQLHRPDPTCDIEESLGALTDLQQVGKIRYAGTSTLAAHEIVEAQWVSDRRRAIRPVCEQSPYSLLARGIESDVLPVAQKYGMGVLTWSPLSGGLLAGRRPDSARGGATTSATLVRQHHTNAVSAPTAAKIAAAEAIASIAEKFGFGVVEFAVAFAAHHPAVTSVIIGPRTADQLESQLGGAHLEFPTEALDALDEIVAPGVTLDPADSARDIPGLHAASRRRSVGSPR